MTGVDRFWSKVRKTDGCWEWIGATTAPGWHGRFLHPETGKLVMASRYSWEIHYGPIPAGLQVLHACDNAPCVRPEHLMLGTQWANMVDAGRKGRMGQTKHKTACVHGHAYTPENTYRAPKTGRRQCRTCRERVQTRGRAA